jgi:hypothetical protein
MPKFPVGGPVNTASELTGSNHVAIDFRKLNCAACTAGALTGKTSGIVVAQVFGSLAKPKKTVAGYEPDIAFTMLGNERRNAKGKGPKFQPPAQNPGQSDYQYSLTVAAVAEESGLHTQIKALKRWVLGQRGGRCDEHGSVQGLILFPAAQDWMARKPSGTEFAVYFTSMAAPTPGHWVYAENRGHTVEFVDYQQFLTAANRPHATKYPSCMGNSAPDAKMLVLAFSP